MTKLLKNRPPVKDRIWYSVYKILVPVSYNQPPNINISITRSAGGGGGGERADKNKSFARAVISKSTVLYRYAVGE